MMTSKISWSVLIVIVFICTVGASTGWSISRRCVARSYDTRVCVQWEYYEEFKMPERPYSNPDITPEQARRAEEARIAKEARRRNNQLKMIYGLRPDKAKVKLKDTCYLEVDSNQFAARLCIERYTNKIETGGEDLDEYYFMRGVSHSMLMHDGNALKDFDLAINLVPKGRYYMSRGKLYYEYDKHERAIEDLTSAIELYNEDGANPFYSYYLRGMAYCKKAEFEKADEDLKMAYELGKEIEYTGENNEVSRCDRSLSEEGDGLLQAQVYLYTDQYDLAIEECVEAIESNSINIDEYYAVRGEVYFKKGDYDLALKDFDMAIELGLKWYYHMHRGELYLATGAYDLAIADLNTAIERYHDEKANPFYPHYLRGMAYCKKGKYSEADEDLSEAKKLVKLTGITFDEIIGASCNRAVGN